VILLQDCPFFFKKVGMKREGVKKGVGRNAPQNKAGAENFRSYRGTIEKKKTHETGRVNVPRKTRQGEHMAV